MGRDTVSRRLRFVCVGEVGDCDLAPVPKPALLFVVSVHGPGGSIRFTLGDISGEGVDSTHRGSSVTMGG